MTVVELCSEGVESARAGWRAGVDRVELCSRLDLDGLTPAPDELHAACALGLEVVALVRPRAGDFVYTDEEWRTLLEQVDEARAGGAHGIAAGALRHDGTVDAERLRELVERAAPLPLCFHRAFDRTPDRAEALEVLVGAGVRRVLTSGGAPDVVSGLPALAELVARAGTRIEVMPGGGVRPDNVARVLRASGARAIHFSARGGPRAHPPTTESAVRAYLAAMRGEREG